MDKRRIQCFGNSRICAIFVSDFRGTFDPPFSVFLDRMINKNLVSQAVVSFLEDKDCFLVDVTISASNSIIVEVDSLNGVDVELCLAITRHLEQEFDRDVEDYSLEVGSSGLTSPFKLKQQYEKNLGKEIEVLVDGKKLIGILQNVSEDSFTICRTFLVKVGKKKEEQTEEITFSYEDVKYAKYNFKFN